MALVLCKYCGAEISEKANTSIKCGKANPVAEKIICAECGKAVVPLKEGVCPICGNPDVFIETSPHLEDSHINLANTEEDACVTTQRKTDLNQERQALHCELQALRDARERVSASAPEMKRDGNDPLSHKKLLLKELRHSEEHVEEIEKLIMSISIWARPLAVGCIIVFACSNFLRAALGYGIVPYDLNTDTANLILGSIGIIVVMVKVYKNKTRKRTLERVLKSNKDEAEKIKIKLKDFDSVVE